MKILISAGDSTNKLAQNCNSVFKNTLEVYSANNLDSALALLDRGEYFDRALIFEQAYNNDNDDYDNRVIKLYEFVQEVKKKIENYTIILSVSDRKFGLSLVETFIGYEEHLSIVESSTLTSQLLTILVTSPLSELKHKCRVLSNDDLLEAEKTRLEQNKSEDEPKDMQQEEREAAIIGRVGMDAWSDSLIDGLDDLDIDTTDSGFIEDENTEKSTQGNVNNFQDGSEEQSSMESEMSKQSDGVQDTYENSLFGDFDPEREGLDAEGLFDTDDGELTLESTETIEESPVSTSNSVENEEEIFGENFEGDDSEKNLNEQFETDFDTVSGFENHKKESSDDAKIDELFEDNNSSTKQNEELNEKIEDSTNEHKNETSELKNKTGRRGLFGIIGGKKSTNKDSRVKEKPMKQNKPRRDKVKHEENSSLKMKLDMYKRNGAVIAVTGGKASGKTTVAANLANVLSGMGYSVLLLDFDTVGRGLSYINKDSFTSMHDNMDKMKASDLKGALNTGIDTVGRFIKVVKNNLHIIGTSLTVDKNTPENSLNADRLSNLLHALIKNYNFVIVDIPFESATGKFNSVLTQADRIVLTERATNNGIMNFLIDITGLDNLDTLNELFVKSSLVFTMEDGLNVLFGRKVRTTAEILESMDTILSELVGYKMEVEFTNFNVVDCLSYNNQYDRFWLTDKFISDTQEGREIFTNLLDNIMEE